ncbi:MAG: exodeoxyribonuclease VII large subunit [Candidatus Hydrogenedens sp.]|nr:exodeoxyribonuclease VII large subunit [Candidatus Hydrogenedens sp.]
MAAASPEIWTVSQLTRRIKSALESAIGSAWISGEISNWKVAASGHAYFTLKDADSQIDAVMFKGKLGRLRFEPESGLEVLAHGTISVYERRGNYQIVLDDMQPRGVGALQLAFEKLKRKLQDEGLFDAEHKKPLPLLPRRIGVVTSPTGAAIRDILNVLGRRFANLHVLLYPARVQGDGAAAEIAEGIRALDDYGVDVMIVGRGGGSLEDLWPFNEEVVVRAVFDARTPIISAVGHEIDYALSDFAADVRAPTPSAAAELVVREQQALADQIGVLRSRLGSALAQRLDRTRYRLDACRNSFVFRRPEELFRQQRMQLDDLDLRLRDSLLDRSADARARLERARSALRYLSPGNQVQRAQERLTVLQRRLAQAGGAAPERARNRLHPLAARLHALSPLAILGRGYALAWKEPGRELVRGAGMLAPGDTLRLRFGEGEAEATVTNVKEQDNG